MEGAKTASYLGDEYMIYLCVVITYTGDAESRKREVIVEKISDKFIA